MVKTSRNDIIPSIGTCMMTRSTCVRSFWVELLMSAWTFARSCDGKTPHHQNITVSGRIRPCSKHFRIYFPFKFPSYRRVLRFEACGDSVKMGLGVCCFDFSTNRRALIGRDTFLPVAPQLWPRRNIRLCHPFRCSLRSK